MHPFQSPFLHLNYPHPLLWLVPLSPLHGRSLHLHLSAGDKNGTAEKCLKLPLLISLLVIHDASIGLDCVVDLITVSPSALSRYDSYHAYPLDPQVASSLLSLNKYNSCQ